MTGPVPWHVGFWVKMIENPGVASIVVGGMAAILAYAVLSLGLVQIILPGIGMVDSVLFGIVIAVFWYVNLTKPY